MQTSQTHENAHSRDLHDAIARAIDLIREGTPSPFNEADQVARAITSVIGKAVPMELLIELVTRVWAFIRPINGPSPSSKDEAEKIALAVERLMQGQGVREIVGDGVRYAQPLGPRLGELAKKLHDEAVGNDTRPPAGHPGHEHAEPGDESINNPVPDHGQGKPSPDKEPLPAPHLQPDPLHTDDRLQPGGEPAPVHGAEDLRQPGERVVPGPDGKPHGGGAPPDTIDEHRRDRPERDQTYQEKHAHEVPPPPPTHKAKHTEPPPPSGTKKR